MSDSSPLFQNEDQEAEHYLGVLRDGGRNEKVLARDRLSHIFERRGMLQQAVELLEANARDGVTDPRLFMTLATHYRALGRPADADAAMAHSASLITRQQAASPPAAQVPAPYQQTPLPQHGFPQQPPGYSPPQYASQPLQVHVAPQMTTTNVIHNRVVVASGNSHPPLIVRIIYFLLFGWYVGFIWIGIALLLFLPIITFPLAIWMLNRTGYAFFL